MCWRRCGTLAMATTPTRKSSEDCEAERPPIRRRRSSRVVRGRASPSGVESGLGPGRAGGTRKFRSARYFTSVIARVSWVKMAGRVYSHSISKI